MSNVRFFGILIVLVVTGLILGKVAADTKTDGNTKTVVKYNRSERETQKHKRINDDQQIELMQQIGSITLPLPHIDDGVLPEGYKVIKQINDHTYIICRNPYAYLVPDYSDPEHKKFLLWYGKNGQAPELSLYAIKPEMQPMSVSAPSIDSRHMMIQSPLPKNISAEDIKTIEINRDMHWLGALSNVLPLEGTPVQTPEQVADFLQSYLQQLKERANNKK